MTRKIENNSLELIFIYIKTFINMNLMSERSLFDERI